MESSNIVLALSSAINIEEQSKILDHIKKHPSKEGTLAKKAYIRSIVIILLIVFCVAIPFCIYTLSKMLGTDTSSEYPSGATNRVNGHISLYDETFWYTDSSQKYEFDLSKYANDNTFEAGENVIIYLDDNNDVISISHQDKGYDVAIDILLMFLIPIVLLLLHFFIGRNTYCKWWNLYVQWYQEEIEPYCFQENFEEVIANKQFYDVRVSIKQLSVEDQKMYKKALFKNIICSLLFLFGIIFIIYLCIKLGLNFKNWIVCGGIAIYVVIFCILIDNYTVEMHRIKHGYYKNNSSK